MVPGSVGRKTRAFSLGISTPYCCVSREVLLQEAILLRLRGSIECLLLSVRKGVPFPILSLLLLLLSRGLIRTRNGTGTQVIVRSVGRAATHD